MELRARSVPWFRIAERTGLPEQTARSRIRRLAATSSSTR
jgi:DNA-binding Lrp family transcriptional regulator